MSIIPILWFRNDSQLIEEKLSGADWSDDIEECEQVVSHSFRDEMDSPQKFQTYFVC